MCKHTKKCHVFSFFDNHYSSVAKEVIALQTGVFLLQVTFNSLMKAIKALSLYARLCVRFKVDVTFLNFFSVFGFESAKAVDDFRLKGLTATTRSLRKQNIHSKLFQKFLPNGIDMLSLLGVFVVYVCALPGPLTPGFGAFLK